MKDGYKILNESLNTHPLQAILDVPEDTYHKKVQNCIHGIFEDTRGVSEKDFKGQDELMKISEGIVKDPNVDLIIQRFEKDNLRPSYCAECIFSKLKGV